MSLVETPGRAHPAELIDIALEKVLTSPICRKDKMSPNTRKRTCARVAALLTAPVLALGLLAPSASADAPLGVEMSGEGLNINFDIAQTIWTVLVSTAIKPLCLNGVETPKDDAFVICPVTDEPVDTN
ncbi:hypothetical protein O3S80_11930 [Streptomyces sp. Lzd4kr]|nr:hypothetical protein [Streptomyces sp. Lzd4kr]